MEYKETLNYYEHSDLKFDDVNPVTGRKIHRDLVLGYSVLLIDEIISGDAFPLVVDFKRTSREAGKNLATSIAQNASKNIPSYGKVYSFGTAQKVKEIKGKEVRYYVKTVDEGRWITKSELSIIVQWAKELAKKKSEGKIQIDDSDVRNEVNSDVVDAEYVETTASSSKSRF